MQGEAMFRFKFYYAYVLMENESERWKAVGSDPMAKILCNLLYTNSKKQIEGTVMGWQIPVLYKLPMILKLN